MTTKKPTIVSVDADAVAIAITTTLDRDPVIASRAKTYLSPQRWIEILELKKSDFEAAAEAETEQAIIQDPAPLSPLSEQPST